MDYRARIYKVMDYISEHIDEALSLDQLSTVACFSKYHFHRLFTAYVGLSVQQYLRWLRLKRSAHQLVLEKDKQIIEIALDAGFESHEAFSRAFKQICGVTPSECRNTEALFLWDKTPYLLPKQENKKMDIIIKSLPKRRLAVLEHHGDPKEMGKSLGKIISWAKEQPVNIKPAPGEAFGFGYHDPKEVAPKDFRFDLALTVPDNLPLTGEIFERILPEGRYAIALHKGSHDNISETIYAMYRDWLPTTEEELGDIPCIFCYQNFEHEVPETALRTEIWMYLKDNSNRR